MPRVYRCLVTEGIDQPGIQGFLHKPTGEPNKTGIVLTHGAGADCEATLLRTMADQMADHGFHVLRCNLAFRQRRRTGPPHPSKAEEDRHSFIQAATFLRQYATRIILAGHSYGGRQATILASENKSVADRLLLFSYPLHPPEKPDQLRTAHFPKLKIPATFVHGSSDSFGAPEEMRAALTLIPAETKLFIVNSAGHDLKKGAFDLFGLIHDLR